MKTTAGMWIDHQKAVIAVISSAGEKTLEIRSNVDKQPGRIDGVRSTEPFEAHSVQSDGCRERRHTDHLNRFYEEVIAAIREAESLLIFGPGEAKGELIKRLEHDKLGGRVLAMETEDKMTDHQIVAKIRDYFQMAHAAHPRQPKERS